MYACYIDNCNREFATENGVNVHIFRGHGIKVGKKKCKPVIPEGATVCNFCKVDFKTTNSLRAHGSEEVCKKRKEHWGTFTCQNKECEKVFKKYAGRKKNKGIIYCSRECHEATFKLHRVTIVCGNKKCLKSFIGTENRKYCCIKCLHESLTGRKIEDTSNMGGPRPGGGYSKFLPFRDRKGRNMKLNREEIIVAEMFDNYRLDWNRNNSKGFQYITLDGLSRKFYPDFYLNDYNLYIEYKGYSTGTMNHKMIDAQQKNPDLNLLIIYGKRKFQDEYGGYLLDDFLLNKDYFFEVIKDSVRKD